jgi:putative colanic acid biosynthesis acetyltransferase WcaF
MQTRLDLYNNSWYWPGASRLKRTIWYFVNFLFFNNGLLPISIVKVFILRAFGAKIGKGVVIKPSVNIKHPWFLEIGDFVWIGENVWIDNLALVKIGSHCCISQGALLLCGNHNMKKTTFDLVVKPIVLETGSWVGARALICPGVTFETHAVLSTGSVATSNLDSWSVYQGNPAIKSRVRYMNEQEWHG